MSDVFASISLAPYLDILHRHRLSFLCTLTVGLLLTAIAVVAMPAVYVSTTLVTIEPPEVPAQYISAGVADHLQDRLKTLSEKVLSRTELDRIIAQFNLYPRRRAEPVATAELVQYMRSRVDLEVTKEAEHAGGGSFELSFEYAEPATAQRVTAELAQAFIEEDRRGRLQQAVATTTFLADRLADARAKLDAKAGEIRAFKNRYAGSLPQELEVNLQTLGSLQSRLQNANEAELALDERRAQLGREMADARSAALASPAGDGAPIAPAARLAAMEAELSALRARYSDQYPDVINLRAAIVALQGRLRPGAKDKLDDFPQPDTGLRREADQIELEQQRILAEIASVKHEIAVYQTHIAATPAHQQEYDSLDRDYAVLEAEYNSLLSKRLAAQAAQKLEERGQGEHFRVIDPADLPLDAEGPDQATLAIGGTVLSVIAACGIAFGLYLFDTSYKHPDELALELKLPVAVTIPQLSELDDLAGRRARWLRAMVGSGLMLTAGASAIWLYIAHRA